MELSEIIISAAFRSIVERREMVMVQAPECKTCIMAMIGLWPEVSTCTVRQSVDHA